MVYLIQLLLAHWPTRLERIASLFVNLRSFLAPLINIQIARLSWNSSPETLVLSVRYWSHRRSARLPVSCQSAKPLLDSLGRNRLIRQGYGHGDTRYHWFNCRNEITFDPLVGIRVRSNNFLNQPSTTYSIFTTVDLDTFTAAHDLLMILIEDLSEFDRMKIPTFISKLIKRQRCINYQNKFSAIPFII